MMKKLSSLLFVFALFAILAGCTADYDSFGTSDYKTFNSIRFVEQDGDAAVYEDEHRIEITLVEPKKGKTTWDSVTVESIDISSMATLHLVDGKFKEFPSDSAALDSLANDVSYVEKNLHKKSKIRVPSSHNVYVMIVSESGLPSIWQLSFTIPGVDASSSSVSEDDDESGDENESSSSSDEESIESSSSSESMDESSSSIVLSDNNNLQLIFAGEIENKTNGDTICVTFPQGTDLSKVVVDSVVIHRSASIDVDPKSIRDWNSEKVFKVTAEDSSVQSWIVIVQSVKNSSTDLQVTFQKQLKVNRSGDTIAIKLQNDQTIEKALVETFAVSDGASVSPAPSEVKTWTASQNFVVTAEDGTKKTWVVTIDIAEADEKASSDKDLLSISAEGEVAKADVDSAAKKIVLHVASQDALAAVKVNVSVSATASQDLQSGSVDLRSPVTMTITAEDASTVKWTITADYPKSSEADILTFKLDGISAMGDIALDASKHTVSFVVPYGIDLSKVLFDATYSKNAKKTAPSGEELDLTKGTATISVTAEDGSVVEWTVNVTVAEPLEKTAAPRIMSMKIAGKAAVVDSVNENGKMVFWVHFDEMPFRADLSKVTVSDIELSKGATIKGIEDGSSYDLGMGATATVTNDDGESVEYTIRAGYQLPGSDFNTWKSSGVMSPDSIWGNANTVGETTSKYTSGSVIGAQIKTNSILGKIASGSLYTAEFNPKGVGTLAMANASTWPDGNELLDFGKKFNARPAYIDVTFNYNGSGDSCDIYLVLENRTGDMNRNRSSSDVNKLVASAWYRSTTADNTGRKNPDVVSVSAADATTKMRTMRMKLHYGIPLAGSPIENSSIFNTKLESKDSKAIDNSLIQGTGEEPVTHIRLVFASSADGNHYKGKSGATLLVDGIRLIY